MSQLPAAVSRRGVLDGSVWQYNREWCRDQSMIALALAMIGDHELARTILARLLAEFVTPEGDTVDSSERRDPDEIELDQNGFLLAAIRGYVLWTGDLGLVRERWPRIVALAEFPLGPAFRHAKSGLLANRREFWERHRAHGIRPGIELVHQLYTWHGLEAASRLAAMVGDNEHARRWESEAGRLRTAMLEDPVYRMADDRGFIKRRGLDGRVQETIDPEPGSGLPSESPLAEVRAALSESGHERGPADRPRHGPARLAPLPADASIARIALEPDLGRGRLRPVQRLVRARLARRLAVRLDLRRARRRRSGRRPDRPPRPGLARRPFPAREPDRGSNSTANGNLRRFPRWGSSPGPGRR